MSYFDDRVFILKGKRITPVAYLEWAKWLENIANRVIGSTDVPGGRVSTVFLGCPPVFFETMVFGGRLNEWQWRYSTYEEAKAGHCRIVKQVHFINRLHARNVGIPYKLSSALTDC